MPTLREQAREKLVERSRLITEGRAQLEALEGKEWPAEDKEIRERRWKDIARLKEEADELTRQADADESLPPENRSGHREPAGDTPRTIECEYRTGGNGYLAGKRIYTVDADDEQRMRTFAAGLQHPRDRTDAERRHLQMDKDPQGGSLVAPQQFVARLIQAVDNRVFFRGLATVEQLLGAKSIGRPSLDTDPGDPTWTTELATGAEDDQMALGARELVPHPLARRMKASRKLLRHSNIGAEALIRERLAYKFSTVLENAYLNGNGASQPLGVFTASDDGIGAGRDVSTGNTATSVTFDGLKSARWALKQAYWPRCSWIASTAFGEQVDKLKDGEGRYIWQQSVVTGQPDRLLGFPINYSAYAPSTFDTGLYVAILGDFSNYWIIDSLDMEIQRLDELYAETNQVGFIGRYEGDGMPVLAEAFVRVKLA